jgi:hypothetical protein
LCSADNHSVHDAAQDIVGGMSGSPILTQDGSAIGVVVTSTGDQREGGPNPRLASSLPGWLLGELNLQSKKLIEPESPPFKLPADWIDENVKHRDTGFALVGAEGLRKTR